MVFLDIGSSLLKEFDRVVFQDGLEVEGEHSRSGGNW
jgi:hypothetical protein